MLVRNLRALSCGLGRRFAFLGVSLCAAALAGCNGSKNQYVPPPPPKVTVAQPLEQKATIYLELTGNTQAINDVDLVARVPGYLESIDYTDGSTVTKGTKLFGIQRNTYEAQLEQAKASLASNQAENINNQADYQRKLTLSKSDFSTQAVLQDAKTKVDQSAAAIQNSQASIELAQINLDYTTVSAPFDGTVTNHLVDIGALVGASGPTKLATIVQVDPLYAYFNLSEPQVLRIKEGLAKQGRTVSQIDLPKIPVEIGLQGEDGYPHKGHLDYASPEVDSSTGTLTVRGIFDNKDHQLLPGLFVRVRIPVLTRDKTLLVRDDAIGINQLGSYVLVLGKDDIVEQKQVQTGQLQGRLRIIESGLDPGDWVVTDGIQLATPGSKITPQKSEMVAEAAPGAADVPAPQPKASP
jgi:RND family efflux transporter MFP subunit